MSGQPHEPSISDEAGVSRQSFTAAHLYAGVLFKAVGYDIVGLRIAALLLMWAAAAVFSWGAIVTLRPLHRSARRPAFAKATIISACSLGALLFYQALMMDPSYNLLNAIALTAAAGFVMLGVSEGAASRWALSRRHAALFLAGVSIGVSAFAKISTGVLLLGVLPLFVILWPGAWGHRLGRALLVVGGFAAWCAIHFTLLQSLSAWWGMIAPESSTGSPLASTSNGWCPWLRFGSVKTGRLRFVLPLPAASTTMRPAAVAVLIASKDGKSHSIATNPSCVDIDPRFGPSA